jgi:hypothetical protein
MTHDPEKYAAAYLSGSMSRRRRKGFEEHILDCEDCWSEVELGRRGRSLAEAARDLAPLKLRERVRMSVEVTPAPMLRWRRFALGASAVAVALVSLVAALDWTLDQQEQPQEIAVLLSDFESGSVLKTTAAKTLPNQLGDLRLRHSRAGRIHGMDVTAHSYTDPAGHEVVIYQADRTFPIAEGAEHASGGETWTAEVEGAVLFCADHPVPSLVVGDDHKEVALAAAELALR